jgi:hypothetical protein
VKEIELVIPEAWYSRSGATDPIPAQSHVLPRGVILR